MRKKLISAVLCAVLAVTSIASASAAGTESSASSLVHYKIVKSLGLSMNHAYFYKSRTNLDSDLEIRLCEPQTNNIVHSQTFDFSDDTIVKKYLIDKKGYDYYINNSGKIDRIYLTNTGGTYDKIKFKLADFSDYFNTDGTHTMSFLGEDEHNYNFTDEGNGYSSYLVFLSGSIFSAISPDEYGYVEIYASTKLGEKTVFMTDFSHKDNGYQAEGGGTSGTLLCGFTMGDVDRNGSVNLADAITIQKETLYLTSFDTLSKRNSDVDDNGRTDLSDAIKLQKYVLGLISE